MNLAIRQTPPAFPSSLESTYVSADEPLLPNEYCPTYSFPEVAVENWQRIDTLEPFSGLIETVSTIDLQQNCGSNLEASGIHIPEFVGSLLGQNSASRTIWDGTSVSSLFVGTESSNILLEFLGRMDPGSSRILTVFASQFVVPAGDSASMSTILNSSHTSLYLTSLSPDLRLLYTALSALINDQVPVQHLENPQSVLEKQLSEMILTFERLGGRRLGQMLDSFPQPLRSSLERGLFCAAVAVRASQVIQAIMERGLDPSKILMGSPSMTPLVYTCSKAFPEIANCITSKTKGDDIDFDSCMNVFPKPGSQSIHVVEIIGTLLRAGMRMQAYDIWRLLYVGHPDLSRQLIPYLTCDDRIHLYASIILDQIFSTCSNNTAVEFVKSLSDTKWCLISMGSGKVVQEHLKNVLDKALKYGHVEAAQSILHTVPVPDSTTLHYAVRAGNASVVQILLQKGASANRRAIDRMGQTWRTGGITDHQELRSPIAESFRAFSLDIMDLLISHGAISALATDYESLNDSIFVACETGRYNLLVFLLSLRTQGKFSTISTLSSPREWRGPICTAIHTGHHHLVPLLLSNGIKPVINDLETALWDRRLDAAEMIVDSVLGGESYGNALHLAVRAQSPLILNALVSAGTNPNVCWSSHAYSHEEKLRTWKWPFELNGYCPAVSTAILCGHMDMLDQLLSMGASLTQRDRIAEREVSLDFRYRPEYISPLLAAIYTNNLDLTVDLLSRGADPFDEAALFHAVKKNRVDLVGVLISAMSAQKLKPAKGFGTQALCAAIKNQNLAMIGDLTLVCDMDNLAPDDWPIYLSSPLGVAMSQGENQCLPFVQALISQGADLNMVAECCDGSRNRTPLLLAIRSGNLEIIQLLVSAGADIHALPKHGVMYTPLQAAIDRGTLEVVQYLLQQGVDVNAPAAQNEGRTALQMAAQHGFIGIAEVLISKGANVNAPAGMILGRTAFEAAAECGRLEMLMYLVEKGADICSDGGTQYNKSLLLAKASGYTGITSYVEKVYAEQRFARAMAMGAASLEFGSDPAFQTPVFDPILCQF